MVRLEFKLQDLWVGAYWATTPNRVDVWVCLIPCFPICIQWLQQFKVGDRVRFENSDTGIISDVLFNGVQPVAIVTLDKSKLQVSAPRYSYEII